PKGEPADIARLHLMSRRYFRGYDEARDKITGIYQSRFLTDPSEGLFAYELNVNRVGGMGMSGKRDTVQLDVGRTLTTPFAISGGGQDRGHQKLLLGHQGSALEHITPAAFHGPHQYSAVKLVQRAFSTGEQVFDFLAEEVEIYLPRIEVDADTKNAIRTAAKPGRRLRVPSVAYAPPAFRPLFGLISFDTATGAGEYLVNGGYDGSTGEWLGFSIPGSRGGCCSGIKQRSRVTLGDGNYQDEETDLNVPAAGHSFSFARAYNSRVSDGGGRLGNGWTHSFAAALRPGADGIILVNRDGESLFRPNGSGGFTSPPSIKGHLTELADGYQIVFDDGTRWQFATSGRLSAIASSSTGDARLQYDDSGLLMSVVDSDGRAVLSFAYSSNGDLAKVSTSQGASVEYSHDDRHRLVAVKDIMGNTKRFGYDESGRMIFKTDWNGNGYSLAYDEAGRWVRTTDPEEYSLRAAYEQERTTAVYVDGRGNARVYELGPRGEELGWIDAAGNKTAFTCNASLQNTSKTDSTGRTELITYNDNGHVVEKVTPSGVVNLSNYDERGRLASVVFDANNSAATLGFGYDENNNISVFTTPDGRRTERTSLPDGRPLMLKRPDNSTVRFEYEADGNLAAIERPDGARIGFEHDPERKLTTLVQPDGTRLAIALDAKGRLLSSTDPNGGKTEFVYDAQGNQVRSIAPDGSATTFSYDKLNRLILTRDALGNVSRREYDASGNLVRSIDPAGNTWSYDYDQLDRLVTTVDPEGFSWSQAYCGDDPIHQPCETVGPDGSVWTREYDVEGRLVRATDAFGLGEEYGYDGLGRRVAVTDRGGGRTEYGYDVNGRSTMIRDALGNETVVGYDDAGRLAAVTDANGHFVTLEYDAMGRLIRETNPLGATHHYAYDAATNAVLHEDPEGNRALLDLDWATGEVRATSNGVPSFNLRVAADGNVEEETTPDISRRMRHDALRRLTEVADLRFSPPKVIRYEYDAVGNRTRLSLDDIQVSYRYDRRGLVREIAGPSGAIRFDYDSRGLRTMVRYPNGTQGLLRYDARGALTSILWVSASGAILTGFSYTYDERGNRTAKRAADGASEEYQYDALSRLVQVRYSRGDRVVKYEYDAVGNRVQREVIRPGGTPPSCNRLLDEDCDGVANAIDNCPETENADQANSDGPQFGDGFDGQDSLGKYTPIQASTASWLIQDGTLYPQPGGGDRYLVRAEFQEDGPLVAKFELAERSQGQVGGIAVRVRDERNLYRAVVEVANGYEKRRIERVSNGVVTLLATHEGPRLGDDYSLVVNGAEMVLFSGATKLAQAEDASMSGGKVALYAGDQGVGFGSILVTPADPRGDACDPCPADPSLTCAAPCLDSDGDGYGLVALSCGEMRHDCGPMDATIHPGAIEKCDTMDNDCDGLVDETCIVQRTAYEYNGFNQVTRVSSESVQEMTYDQRGNLTAIREPSQWARFEYDPAGRLVLATDSTGRENRMAYDSRGLRVKLVDSRGAHLTVLDNVDELAEFSENGELESFLIRDPARVDMAFAELTRDGPRYFYHDGLGSVAAVGSQSGLLAARFEYDAFGERSQEFGAQVTPWGFTGRRHDSESGLLYFRSRYYNPGLGMFMSEDTHNLRSRQARPGRGEPLHSETLHRYKYAEQDPVNRVDPMGTWGLSMALDFTAAFGVGFTAGISLNFAPGGNILALVVGLQAGVTAAISADFTIFPGPWLGFEKVSRICDLMGIFVSVGLSLPYRFSGISLVFNDVGSVVGFALSISWGADVSELSWWRGHPESPFLSGNMTWTVPMIGFSLHQCCRDIPTPSGARVCI
ncbi:MAG: hypothetical protein HY698_14865, partial [Deltaproteobacteria bacterium]|nr:hypothetical protein [Deltaproteobacteria bacterium]